MSGLKFIETSAGLLRMISLFQLLFIRNCKLFTAFGPAACQYFTAIGCLHPFTETMHRLTTFAMRLECTFHF